MTPWWNRPKTKRVRLERSPIPVIEMTREQAESADMLKWDGEIVTVAKRRWEKGLGIVQCEPGQETPMRVRVLEDAVIH
jgi:hypothetical protein